MEVKWGEQSHEEMLFTAISYRWQDETTVNKKDQYQRLLSSTSLFGMLDDNIDDVLVKEELKGRAGRRLAGNFDGLDRNGDGELSREEYSAIFVATNNDD